MDFAVGKARHVAAHRHREGIYAQHRAVISQIMERSEDEAKD